jgi:hypothetical protein
VDRLFVRKSGFCWRQKEGTKFWRLPSYEVVGFVSCFVKRLGRAPELTPEFSEGLCEVSCLFG